jgi:S-adenosylmethionine decarboxylase
MSGLEWMVEAYDCDAVAVADPARLSAFLDRLIDELGLHPVGAPLWHKFGPEGGGVTGLCLLAESHFACPHVPGASFDDRESVLLQRAAGMGFSRLSHP